MKVPAENNHGVSFFHIFEDDICKNALLQIFKKISLVDPSFIEVRVLQQEAIQKEMPYVTFLGISRTGPFANII